MGFRGGVGAGCAGAGGGGASGCVGGGGGGDFVHTIQQ